MSVGLAIGPAATPVGPLDTRRLVIAMGHDGLGDPRPDGICGVRDVDVLLQKVLESRTVLVEHRAGVAPVRLRSRAARESDVAWLSRVLTEVLGQVSDTDLACALVCDAIQRTAGVRVDIECWAVNQATSRPIDSGSSRQTWRDEIPLIRSARGTWMLLCPTGSIGLEDLYPTLLAALTRCLCEADADDAPVLNMPQQLVHAVSCGDPATFVTVAAQLLDGSVCLRDRSGSVVATAGRNVRASTGRNVPAITGRNVQAVDAHEIVLRDESGLWGALVIDTAREVGADLGLADLALALLRLRAADSERRALENRLAVLGCFVEHDLDDPYRVRKQARRMVMITPAGAGKPPVGLLSVGRLLGAAGAIPQLADVSLTAQDDAVIGVYSDDGADAGTHRRSWERLLADVDRGAALRVAISPSIYTSGGSDSKAHYQLLGQVSRLQRDGAAMFDVPAIAVVDELGPLTGVLNAVPGAQVLPYVQRVLGDLITDDRFGGQLIDTLYAYLKTGGSPSGAGALLHMHGSSVKYRMRILRELLGERLDDPSKRFDLELALRLYLAERDLAAGLPR